MEDWEVEWLLMDEEKQDALNKKVLPYKGAEVTLDFTELLDSKRSDGVKIISLEKKDMDIIKTHFIDKCDFLNVKNFEEKEFLVIPQEIYKKLENIFLVNFKNEISTNNIVLNENITLLLSTIVCLMSGVQLNNKGKRKDTNISLLKLKNKLQKRFVGFIDVERYKDTPIFEDEFLLQKMSLEFYNIDSKTTEMITFKGDNFHSHTFHRILVHYLRLMLFDIDFKDKDIIKVNTNKEFCKAFYCFIDSQTEFSTRNGISIRKILLLFLVIYKDILKLKFPKVTDELELVEKWL